MPMSWADKFNLLNEFNVLRIICGLFFIPHIIGKITVPATLEFFVKAGFKPPATWMYIAGAIETVVTICLLFDIQTKWVGLIAFVHLLVAGAATYKVTKSWIWVIGGIEYCVFWAICCLAVAMHAWHSGM
jgi:putative oxidoreductase